MKNTEITKYKIYLSKRKLQLLEKPISTQLKALHKCLICNHKWNPKINNVQNGSGCPICGISKVRKLKLLRGRDTFKAQVHSANMTLIDKYIDNITAINILCNICSTTVCTTPSKFRRFRNKCKVCDPNKTRSMSDKVKQDFLNLLKTKKYKLLSEYKGIAVKVELLCHCGCKWQPVPHSITSGSGCPSCAIAKSYSYKTCKIQGRVLHLQGYEHIAAQWLVSTTSLDIKKLKVGTGHARYFNYVSNDIIHTYSPDFEINSSIIEVKSTYTAGLLSKGTRKSDPSFIVLKAKAKSVIEHGYRFHLLMFEIDKGFILKAKIPKNWLELTRIQFNARVQWQDITNILPLHFRKVYGYN